MEIQGLPKFLTSYPFLEIRGLYIEILGRRAILGDSRPIEILGLWAILGNSLEKALTILIGRKVVAYSLASDAVAAGSTSEITGPWNEYIYILGTFVASRYFFEKSSWQHR